MYRLQEMEKLCPFSRKYRTTELEGDELYD